MNSVDSKRFPVAGSRVLVTGGAGFLGSHVVESLLSARARQVVVFDNLSSGSLENLAEVRDDHRLRVIEADLRDVEAVVAATRGVDYVVHLAALPLDRTLASPRECFEVMVDGTVNLLEAAVDTRVKKLVLGSCASVYGKSPRFPVDEEHPLEGGSAFGAAKIAAEHFARAYHRMYGLEWNALRFFRVHGPRMTAVAPTPATPAGPELVHACAASRAVLLALESAATDRVFNIASGCEGNAARARAEVGWTPEAAPTVLHDAFARGEPLPA